MCTTSTFRHDLCQFEWQNITTLGIRTPIRLLKRHRYKVTLTPLVYTCFVWGKFYKNNEPRFEATWERNVLYGFQHCFWLIVDGSFEVISKRIKSVTRWQLAMKLRKIEAQVTIYWFLSFKKRFKLQMSILCLLRRCWAILNMIFVGSVIVQDYIAQLIPGWIQDLSVRVQSRPRTIFILQHILL